MVKILGKSLTDSEIAKMMKEADNDRDGHMMNLTISLSNYSNVTVEIHGWAKKWPSCLMKVFPVLLPQLATKIHAIWSPLGDT